MLELPLHTSLIKINLHISTCEVRIMQESV